MLALSRERDWDFDAGLLPLDFANTAEWHASPKPSERLNAYPDLMTWSVEAGLMTEAEARSVLEDAEDRSEEAAAVLDRAINLREAIYRVLSAVAAGKKPVQEDLDDLNAALAEALSRARIEPAPKGFSWAWSGADQSLDRMLWPILRETAELLTSDDLDRIGECADDRGCGYLFYDISRNHSRRWCSMESCGNRAKARRHYGRKKVRG